MIYETKVDNSFPTAQVFLDESSAPYRLDKNAKVGGILLYIWGDMPSMLLSTKSKIDIEVISVEAILGKSKWFLNCTYNLNKNLIANHL